MRHLRKPSNMEDKRVNNKDKNKTHTHTHTEEMQRKHKQYKQKTEKNMFSMVCNRMYS